MQSGIHTEPQTVNSGANTIGRISMIHYPTPNNVHLSYSGKRGQDSKKLSEYDTPRQLAHLFGVD